VRGGNLFLPPRALERTYSDPRLRRDLTLVRPVCRFFWNCFSSERLLPAFYYFTGATFPPEGGSMATSKHNVRFPRESESYRAARNELLDSEIELRRAIESVATQ